MSASDRRTRQVSAGLIRVRTGDQDYVISALCTHRQGRLVYGYVNERTQRITCPLHHSTFDLGTGCPLSGPAESALRVEETDDEDESEGEGARHG